MSSTIVTQGMSFRKARLLNSTDNGFPSRISTITPPTGTGVIDLTFTEVGSTGGEVQNGMRIIPYTLGADNDTFAVRVIGWSSIAAAGVATLWVPVVLVELACTASSAVGIALSAVLNTERFADTIALTTGNDDVSVDIVSPTGNVIAHAMLDLKGFQKAEITFNNNTGAQANTAGTMNALVALL